MPPRSPCTAQRKKLPKYKQLARDGRTHETLERVRYQVNARGPEHPCKPAGDDAPGRTACYHPTQHSRRRKTCSLLVDPRSPLHDFAPGFYLVGGPRFRDETLVCTAWDIAQYESEDVDTRVQPPARSVAVLGPYPHPVTGRLVVKCLLVDALEEVRNLDDMGRVFTPSDMSERGAMVPDVQMLRDFAQDLPDVAEYVQVKHVVDNSVRELLMIDAKLEALDDACAQDPVFEKRVRTIARSFYEAALYFRRWAGPGRKVPLDLLKEVGDRSNPLSPALRGKAVRSTTTGVRLVDGGGDEADAADYVMDPEGTLTNMSQAHLNTILSVYDLLSARQRRIVRDAFQLGTPFRIVHGNGRFWLNTYDPNIYGGNPSDMDIDVFAMCFGTRDGNARGFTAVSSVQGTGTYCVQIAAIQIVRLVQTLLPYLYKSRPAWAHADGEFDNVHT